MRFARSSFLILLLFSIAAFIEAKTLQQNLEVKLRGAFSSLYESHFGIDYPYNEKILSSAIHASKFHHDHASMKSFNRVMEAKYLLQEQIKINPGYVLKVAFDSISQIDSRDEYSPKMQTPEESLHDVSISTGAVIALYLFHTEEQDQVILEFMKKASSSILKELFLINYEWLHNRPHPERWITFVETIPDSVFSIEKRMGIVERLRQTDVEKFGIMLDRPTAQSP